MNREIKFRVYTEISPEILGMKYFDLSDTSERNNTIMQYTGLKDKNGKEIYEGDIIQYTPTEESEWFSIFRKKKITGITRLVGYGKGAFRLRTVFGNTDFSWDTEPLLRDYLFNETEGGEIIGNIYENPELLNNK